MTSMSRPKRSVEERWRSRLLNLAPRQWQTDTWHDLCEALDLIEEGDTESAKDWIDETRSRFEPAFLAAQDRSSDYGLVLSEAELSERFLREGVRDWWRALDLLEQGAPAEVILQKAETGQRLLIGVQMLEQTFG